MKLGRGSPRDCSNRKLAAFLVLLGLVVIVVLAAAIAQGQTTPVQVTAKLIDGTGNVYRQGFVHFELQNCGANFPLVTSGSTTVAKSSFDLKPNQVNGSIAGQVIGYDQIFCGGIASTEYAVTVMKDANTPVGPSKNYLLCSTSAPANTQCSNQVAGLFDLASAQPMDQPVQPGHVQLYGNPTKDQLWNQPAGTKATLRGTFDVSGVNWIGLPTGGGGGGGISSITGSGPISVSAGNNPIISIQKSDATHDGYVSSTDWNTFNSKGLGSVTSAGITVPQGLAVSGCPITNAGTCAITLNGQFPVSSLGTGAPSSTNFLNGSGAWQSAVTFGGVPVLQFAAGTNITGSVTSNILTLNSTSAVTYPIAAPEGSATAPQYSFALHPEIGLASVLGTGSVNPIRSVQVTGPSGPGNIILTVSSPINTFRWSIGDTFQIASLPATNSLNTLNSITFTATAVGQTTPTGTVTFSATTSVANGTYAVTQGSVSNWDLSIDAHTSVFNRLKSSTANSSRTGTMQGARRDAWKFRSGAIDDTGIDIAALRGAKQNSPANAIGAGIITSSGTNNSGASSITVAKGAGADWSATTADYILIDQPDANGEADLQMYQVRTNTTVTQGTTTSLPVTPNLRTNISAGALIVASWARTQVGDASGVRVVGVLELTDTANYPDGCLTIASGLVTSTGLTCGGSGASDGAAGRLQISGGSGAFTSDSNLTWDSTNVKVTIGTLTIQGKSTVPNQASFTNGAQACTLPGSGKSAWCFDTDGFFKVSEGNGAYFRPGNGAGSGNVVIQGSPSAGQTAEWSDGTHIQGVSPTGTGSYVKGTAPTIAGGLFDVLKDTSGHAGLTLVATASAVDSLQVVSAATANPATIALQAIGSDSNINVNIIPKGTGVVLCNGIACGGGSSSYTNLFQSDANTLTQRNSTVTQAYQVMATYTDAANFNGVEIGGNYIKTTRQGTGVSGPFRFGVDSNGISFRGWQVLTGSLTLAPFNTASAPDIGTSSNRAGVLWAGSADFSGAVTVSITNEGVTGTTLNKLAKLTGAPSTAVIAGTSDVFGIAGIVTSGAGITSASTVAYSGTASCVFDAGTTANHYVIPSTTVAGDCHDSGVATSAAPPTGVQIIGAVQTTNVAAGTYAVLLGFEVGGGAGGGSGTVTTVSTSGGAPLFSTVVNNPTTAPQIVFTPSNAAANTIYANATGSSAQPTFVQALLTGSLFSNQGNNTQVLIGNNAGNLSFGQVNAATMIAGNLAVGQFNGGLNATASTVWCGNLTWCTPAGGGNVSVTGTTPVAGQSTEFSGATTIRAVVNTGSGNVVRQTAPTLTNPLIPTIKDGSGNSALDIIATLAAVNSFNMTNAATGGDPTFGVQGADANINLVLAPKGAGVVKVNGPIQTAGVTGYHQGPEGIDPGKCASTFDTIYASSANHYWTMCNNGGTQQKVIGSGADINTSDQVVGLHLAFSGAGSVAYNNGSTWTSFAGNNSGTSYLCENSSGVPAWCASTSGVAWSALQNPASSLTLTMGANATTFNYATALSNAFAWVNTTAATVSVAQSSPIIGLQGNYWSSTGPASAPDIWQIQNIVSAGLDATSTLTFAHNRTGGLVSAPGYKTTGTTALSSVEGTAPTCLALSDIFYADSTLHGWKMCNNNGTGVPVIGGPASSTNTNLASFNGTSGGLVQDTGIASTTVTVAASNYVINEVIAAAGNSHATLSTGVLYTNLVQAAGNIVSGDVPAGNGTKGLTDSGVLAANMNFSTVNVTTDSIVTGSANTRQLKDSGILITNTYHTGTKADVLNTQTYCADAGASDTYACNLSVAPTYTTGKFRACFLANTANTGAASINFNSLGALPIKVPLRGSITANPLDGDIQAGSTVCGYYDGTNFVETSQPTVALSTFPSATLNGSLVFFNASNWATFAGNASGTKFLQEDASGNMSWAAGSSIIALSAVTAASGANTIQNGDNTQTWQWLLTTSGGIGFDFTEPSASSAAGTPYLNRIHTFASSTVNPLLVTAGGTANGIRVLKSGFLTKAGTGGIDSNMNYCDVTDGTKCAQFTLSGITTATTRAVTIPDAASTTVVADTGTTHNFLTAISAAGVISKAQPAVADLSDGANVVKASSPGVGLCHFAGSTQTCTSSLVVATDITSATITGTQIASGIALAGSPTTTTQTAKDNSTKIATTAYVDAATGLTTGTSVTLTAPRQYFVCTGTCTITVPVPAAGYEFCVMNDDNVATVITLSAIGSSARYENTARTAYGTAGTGTFVSGGAVGDKVCLLGRDSTHYLAASSTGTWTAN